MLNYLLYIISVIYPIFIAIYIIRKFRKIMDNNNDHSASESSADNNDDHSASEISADNNDELLDMYTKYVNKKYTLEDISSLSSYNELFKDSSINDNDLAIFIKNYLKNINNVYDCVNMFENCGNLYHLPSSVNNCFIIYEFNKNLKQRGIKPFKYSHKLISENMNDINERILTILKNYPLEYNDIVVRRMHNKHTYKLSYFTHELRTMFRYKFTKILDKLKIQHNSHLTYNEISNIVYYYLETIMKHNNYSLFRKYRLTYKNEDSVPSLINNDIDLRYEIRYEYIFLPFISLIFERLLTNDESFEHYDTVNKNVIELYEDLQRIFIPIYSKDIISCDNKMINILREIVNYL